MGSIKEELEEAKQTASSGTSVGGSSLNKVRDEYNQKVEEVSGGAIKELNKMGHESSASVDFENKKRK